MRTKFFFGLLSLLLLNIYACNQTDNKGIETENAHAVRELYLSSIEAFNKGNLELFLANFAPDIRMYGTDGNYIGHDALHERFKKVFQQQPDMKMEIPELKLEVLSKEVVLVDFKWKLYPMGHGPAYSGIGSGIYTYRNDKWMEILEIETVIHIDEELRQQN